MDLTTLADEWGKRLRSCEYAGEFVVPEEELPIIAKNVRQELFSSRNSAKVRTCLLVLAINSMYYDHDDTGFWVHYCNLLNVEDIEPWHAMLGNMLERELLENGFLDQAKPGPFRFVAPLHEQCGITRREIPQFASLLNSLAKEHGWDGILIIDREKFDKSVESHISGKYLSLFLLDDQGWCFTRDVTHNVSQFRRGIFNLQTLEQLPGYRTGFFHDLLEAMDQKPFPTTKHIVRPPLPRLIFLPDFIQIALAFDQRSINAGAYRFNGKKVHRNPIPLESENMYEETFSGERLNSDGVWEDWSIPGWIPSETPIGLYHIDRGYLKHQKKISPGKYYMIASYQNPPPTEVQLCAYGMVNLPFDGLDYDAWLILIERSTNLKFLGFDQKSSNDVVDLISWADENNKLQGTYEIEKAFVGKLPPIVLSRPELFSSNSVGLFVDDGYKVRRVMPAEFKDDRFYIDLPIKTWGRIWVEPINRMHEFSGMDTLGELSFCILPECSITWPQLLYGIEDRPKISFVSKHNDIWLEIEDAEPIGGDGKTWLVNPGVRIIQGYLRIGNSEVPLAHCLFRADIHKKGEARTPLLYTSDFQNQISLIVSGIPKTKAEIGITNGKKISRLGELGLFNDAGEVSISTFTIRDALERYSSPVAQFVVMAGSSEVRTNTFYFNDDAFNKWLSNPSSTTNEQWCTILPSPLAEMFDKILHIRAAPIRQVNLPVNAESIPVRLMRLFEVFRRLCFLFDGANLPERPDVTQDIIISESRDENQEIGATVSWFVRAKKVCDAEKITEGNDTESLLVEYPELLWQPPFQRWRDKIEDIVRHLKDDIEALPLIDEWKKDVERCYAEPYASRIASQAGGRDLTHAWVTYRANNLPAAANMAKNLLNRGTSSPIADLAAILLRICWFRLGLFKSQPNINIQSSNKLLSSTYRDLMSIITFADWTNEHAYPVIDNLCRLVEALPTTRRDFILLKLFTETDHDLNLEDERDWLVCYCKLLMMRKNNMDRKTKHAVTLCPQVINNVPASPDRNLIIEIMEKYL